MGVILKWIGVIIPAALGAVVSALLVEKVAREEVHALLEDKNDEDDDEEYSILDEE